jgi:hypothetical protein
MDPHLVREYYAAGSAAFYLGVLKDTCTGMQRQHRPN